MRPTRPKPMAPMPTRSLAPRTRFQDAADRAAAVPVLRKLRRVRPCGLCFTCWFEGLFMFKRGAYGLEGKWLRHPPRPVLRKEPVMRRAALFRPLADDCRRHANRLNEQ